MKTVLLAKVITKKQFNAIKKILNNKIYSSKKQIDLIVDYLKPNEEQINNKGLDLRFLAYNLQYQLTKQYFDKLKR